MTADAAVAPETAPLDVKEPKQWTKEQEALLKKVKKEGGKRGVEIEGASDMGGLEFFCTMVELPEGDLDLLEESMHAMNEECDPSEEERKGGAGKVGKMIFSSGTERLAIVCNVPADKHDKIKAKDWMAIICEQVGGRVVRGDDSLACGEVVKDTDKNIFPIKVKDEALNLSLQHLKKNGLFPDKADDSDEEFVFGDDDFPA